jgi:hypothetical protein
MKLLHSVSHGRLDPAIPLRRVNALYNIEITGARRFVVAR